MDGLQIGDQMYVKIVATESGPMAQIPLSVLADLLEAKAKTTAPGEPNWKPQSKPKAARSREFFGILGSTNRSILEHLAQHGITSRRDLLNILSSTGEPRERFSCGLYKLRDWGFVSQDSSGRWIISAAGKRVLAESIDTGTEDDQAFVDACRDVVDGIEAT